MTSTDVTGAGYVGQSSTTLNKTTTPDLTSSYPLDQLHCLEQKTSVGVILRNICLAPTTGIRRMKAAADLTHSRRNLIAPFHHTTINMSFSNTDTGSKPADPYTQKNEQEPSLKEKVEDLGQFVDRTKFCMMTTKTADGHLASRCMALAAKEGNGIDFIFHTNTESGKTDDLDANPDINLGFLSSSGEWASVSGKATVETDRAKVREHYSPALKAWLGDLGDGKHDGGPEDPRIGLIKIKSQTIQYAVSRKNMLSAVVDVAKGAVTGETPTINKLRKIEEGEVQQWRAS